MRTSTKMQNTLLLPFLDLYKLTTPAICIILWHVFEKKNHKKQSPAKISSAQKWRKCKIKMVILTDLLVKMTWHEKCFVSIFQTEHYFFSFSFADINVLEKSWYVSSLVKNAKMCFQKCIGTLSPLKEVHCTVPWPLKC